MKRRSFVGAAAALASLASLPRAFAAASRYDFIVVGAGTAGLPAAIFASRRGARVLLLDAAPDIGGTLHLSTGQMSAAGTKLQKSKGIVDTPQMHFDDCMRISHRTADPDIVRLAVINAAATFDWLCDNGLQPLPAHPVLGEGHEPYSERRYAWGPQGGKSILAVLREQLKPELASGRVELKLETPVTALLTDDAGAVVGVRVKSGLREQVYFGRHVLLTCGGYAMNPEMFERLSGYRHYAAMSYPYSQGAGYELGVSVGGYVRGRQNYISNFGSILQDDKVPSGFFTRWQVVPQKRQPWEIYVNVRGERFIREDEPSVDVREHALLKQPDLRYWIVFDRPILDQAPPGIPDWSKDELVSIFNTHPYFSSADTLDGLAAKIGIDAAALKKTVEDYNQGVARKKDALDREHMPAKIGGKGPYYAVRHQGTSITSTVGLTVDPELRVMRAGGTPVPNLYAAGELLGSGQTMGNAAVGGMMVTPALTFGRLLGSRLPVGAA
jgi:fumarate reductase flavoprotein subunit